ncbi:MAG: hypothetical protein Q7U76_12410 [Nitrospirota bacterium]|nr:hypothetical protein [Nitrospirota bacterium]
MPKAKPVSLHPLSFDEAIKALLGVTAEPKQRKSRGKSTDDVKPRRAKRPTKS